MKNDLIIPDYHLHTRLCNHAEGEMEEYVERAIDLGLAEIGFSDHMPVMPESAFCMKFDELPLYVRRVLELRKRYEGSIVIRLGCEMDIELDRLDDIRRILDTYPFDYVIGSLHYLDSWPFDQEQYSDVFRRENVYGIYERYFEAVIRAAGTGLFDIVGHIDVIKCLGYRPEVDLVPLYDRVAGVLRDLDLAYELNTSGFDKPVGEQYPSTEFIAVLRRYGVPVTTGSDSHRPEHVGRYFDRAGALLSDAGYESVTVFEERRRKQTPLGDYGGISSDSDQGCAGGLSR